MEDPTVVQTEGQQQGARQVSSSTRPQIPGYQVERLIGQGSFGEVWAALQLRTGQQVALKLFKRSHPGDWSRLRAELDRLGDVAEHPYVVSLLDADLDHDPAFLVMPLLPFSLSAQPQPSPSQALQWLEQMALALRYMHHKGILHCDFKPSNVLLDDEMRVRVADFGQSLRHNDQQGTYGTLGFMAPEQAALGTEKPGSQPGVAWDVYGWGATAYHLLSHRCPRLRPEDLTALSALPPDQRLKEYPARLAASRLIPLRQLNPGVDRDLSALVESCLALDPERRPHSMEQVLDDLERRRRGDPLLCKRPWSLSYRAGKWLSRPLVAASTVFLVLAAAGLGLAFDRQRTQLAELKNLQALQAERQGRFDEACLWWAAAAADKATNPFAQLRLTHYLTPLRWALGVPHAGGLIFSPNGQLLLIPSSRPGPTAQVLDVESGNLRFVLQGIDQPVSGAEFSPDSRRLWVHWGAWSHQVWDATTGKPLTPVIRARPESLPLPAGLLTRPHSTVWGPQSDWLVCSTGPDQVQLFRAQTGQPITPPLAAPNGWFVNQAGTRLLSSSALWELPSGKCLLRFDPANQLAAASEHWAVMVNGQKARLIEGLSGQTVKLLPLAAAYQLSPAGDKLLITGNHSQIWDLRHPAPPLELNAALLPEFAQFSADGTHLASVADSHLSCWRTDRPEPLAEFEEPFNPHSAEVELSPTGEQVIAYDFSTCRLFGSTGVALSPRLPCHSLARFSPDGRRLAVASPDGVRLWDVAPPQGPIRLQHPGAARVQSDFSADGQRLATGSDTGFVSLWNRSGQRLWRKDLSQSVDQICFAPQGQVLAAVAAGQFHLIDQTGQERFPPVDLEGLQSVAFSADGRWILGQGPNQARVWDSRTGAPLTDPVTRLEISPDGHWLATNRQRLKREATPAAVWDLTQTRPHPRPLAPDVRAFHFSRDSQRLAAQERSGTVRCWSLPQLQPTTSPFACSREVELEFTQDHEHLLLNALEGAELLDLTTGKSRGADPAAPARLSPDGHWLVFEGRQSLEIWTGTGQPSGSMDCASSVIDVAFSPDSKQLVALNAEDQIRVWDLLTAQARPPFPVSLGRPFVYGDVPSCSPDGRFLCISGHLWDLASGTPWTQAQGRTLAFSSDGQDLASSDGDGSVRLYDLRAPQLHPSLSAVEGWTGRRLLSNGDILWTPP